FPLFHFHHQRGCGSFRSNRISDELHRTEACLQNVAAKHTVSSLRRSLRDQTYSAHTGENAPQYSVDLRPESSSLLAHHSVTVSKGLRCPEEGQRELFCVSLCTAVFAADISQMVVKLVNQYIRVVEIFLARYVDRLFTMDVAS